MLVMGSRTVWFLAAALLAPTTGALAQARWTVDPKFSLAWWQMNPHMNHLWATTCPQEPSWRPGEDRNAGWYMRNLTGSSSTLDTVNVPLYPRYAARDVCANAVTGEVEALDTVTWRGIRGQVVVKADQLFSGHPQRDKFAREGVLEAPVHPEIRFAIDSLVGVARRGDTLSGSAVGVFTLRGVSRPSVASVRMWPEAGGLRVVAKFNILAKALVEEYGMSAYALGLGVGLRIWHHLFMGVDLVMRPEAVAGN